METELRKYLTKLTKMQLHLNLSAVHTFALPVVMQSN